MPARVFAALAKGLQQVCTHDILCTCLYNPKKCPPKYYAMKGAEFTINVSDSIICKPCPRGSSGSDGVARPKPNFWGYKANTLIKFAQCPPGCCCNFKGFVSYISCHGNRTGILRGRIGRTANFTCHAVFSSNNSFCPSRRGSYCLLACCSAAHVIALHLWQLVELMLCIIDQYLKIFINEDIHHCCVIKSSNCNFVIFI